MYNHRSYHQHRTRAYEESKGNNELFEYDEKEPLEMTPEREALSQQPAGKTVKRSAISAPQLNIIYLLRYYGTDRNLAGRR